MWNDDDNGFLDDLADTLDPLHINDILFGNGDGRTSFEETMTAELLGEDDFSDCDYGSDDNDPF